MMRCAIRDEAYSTSYRNKLLDQWNNLRQGNKTINEYIT